VREAENRVPDLVLAYCGEGLLYVLLGSSSVVLDNLHDFVNIHEAGAHRYDEEHHNDVLEH